MQSDAAARRTTTWLAILGYCVVASGLPLPLGGNAPAGGRDEAAARRLAAKDRSRPFPCMDKPCGCATAEQCFTSCCCNTPAQTLAWARARGVDVGVLMGLERRVAAAAVPGPPAENESCCTAAASSCCRGGDDARADEAVSDERESGCGVATGSPRHDDGIAGADEPEPRDREPPAQPRIVTLRAMLACGGIVADWFAAGASLPPPKLECGLTWVCVGQLLSAGVSAAGTRDVPEPPPPRVA